MAKRVGTAEFEAEVLKEKLPVIVEFYSDSCIPDRKSTRLNSQSLRHLVCRLLLEKNKRSYSRHLS